MGKKKKPYIALLIAISVLSITIMINSYQNYRTHQKIFEQYQEILQNELRIQQTQNQILEILAGIL